MVSFSALPEVHPVLEVLDHDEVDAYHKKRDDQEGRKTQDRICPEHDYHNRDYQSQVGNQAGDEPREHLLQRRHVVDEPREDLSGGP